MIIKKADKPMRFEQINTIVVDPATQRIIHSNHWKYSNGHRLDENLRKVLSRGWEVIYRNGHKLLTEQVAVEDLLNNVILGDEKSGRWSVFVKGDDLVFAQQMTNGKVCAEDEQGKKTYYADIKAFLESIPEYVLDGVIDDEEKGDE